MLRKHLLADFGKLWTLSSYQRVGGEIDHVLEDELMPFEILEPLSTVVYDHSYE